MALRYLLTLLAKEKIASNAWAFTLEQPEGFDFKPGQYIRIYDPIVGESVFRDFTIASSPFEKNHMLLILKEGISEYKKNLFSINVGGKLLVDAPLGRFYLHEEEKIPLVFVAGGIGITPFYSMIQYVKEKKLNLPITLIASFSRVEDMVFSTELKELEKQSSNLKIVYTITKPEQSVVHGNLHTGRISDELIQTYVHDISDPIFLISGSPSFVIDMEDLLTNMKVSSSHIRVEVFLGFN